MDELTKLLSRDPRGPVKQCRCGVTIPITKRSGLCFFCERPRLPGAARGG